MGHAILAPKPGKTSRKRIVRRAERWLVDYETEGNTVVNLTHSQCQYIHADDLRSPSPRRGDFTPLPRYTRSMEDRCISGWIRGRDVALAVITAIAAAPIWGVASVCVRVDLGAPVLFKQERPGLRGRPFLMVKFRTMRAIEAAGAGSDEERLTPLGRFLRSTSIDELPTLWNVLRGDMSIVGPRPLLMEYLDRYSPEQARRHEVKPGITGWAQVNGRNALSWDERLAMDVWYVDNRSWLLDASILWRTIVRVLFREGISAPGHATMPDFLGPTGTVCERIIDP